ncbi:MAG: GNAT family N-acetyltransferase [Stenomitos rutilans HA7619-LM2]|jgi:GNAT superfamily N-acetyltransferase|nr:GNAT family N-acetyltransferase [Stenomitos rutilans HA7619-LM2]
MSSVDQFTLRSITQDEIPRVKQFVKQVFQVDRDGYEDWYENWVEQWGSERVPTVLVAERQVNLVGVAVSHYNAFHPHWVEVMVGVHPNFRRQGLGRWLHQALLQASSLQPHHLGTNGSYYRGNDHAEAFLFALGYQHTLDCHCLELDLQGFDFSHHLTLPSLPECNHLKLVSFTDLFTHAEMPQHVSHFLAYRYGEEHFWSPPQPLEHPVWKDFPLKGVLPALSFGLLTDDRIVGAATACIQGNDTLDMMWGYISRQYSIETAGLLLQTLYAHQFKAARARGLTRGDIEVDTTDLVIFSLFHWFPIEKATVWRILQKPRTTSNHSGAADDLNCL